MSLLLCALLLAAAAAASELVVHPVRVSHRASAADLWSAPSWRAKCTLAKSDSDISADALFALQNRYLEAETLPSPIELLKARSLDQTQSNVSADDFVQVAETFTLSIEDEATETGGVHVGAPLNLECEWRARSIVDMTGNAWQPQLRQDFKQAPPLQRGRIVRLLRAVRGTLKFLRKLAQLALGLLLHEHFSSATARSHAWDQFKHYKRGAIKTMHIALRAFTSACAVSWARIQTKIAHAKRHRG
jgi:hypothetical protein